MRRREATAFGRTALVLGEIRRSRRRRRRGHGATCRWHRSQSHRRRVHRVARQGASATVVHRHSRSEQHCPAGPASPRSPWCSIGQAHARAVIAVHPGVAGGAVPKASPARRTAGSDGGRRPGAVQRDLAVAGLDLDGVTGREPTFEDRQGQRIDQALLDHPLERAGAIGGVIAEVAQ